MSLNNTFLDHPATQRLPKTEQEWIDFTRVLTASTVSSEVVDTSIQEQVAVAQAAAEAAQTSADAAQTDADTAQAAATAAQSSANTAQATAEAAQTTANSVWLSGFIDDISAATASGRICMVAPCAGTISKIYVCINDATSGGDAVIAMSIDSIGITSGNVTVTDASTAGGIFNSTPSALNAVAEGDLIQAVSNGGGSSTCKAHILMKITRT